MAENMTATTPALEYNTLSTDPSVGVIKMCLHKKWDSTYPSLFFAAVMNRMHDAK